MQEQKNRENRCRADIYSEPVSALRPAMSRRGWFVTRLAFIAVMTCVCFLGLRSGVVVVAGPALISTVVLALVARDLTRTPRTQQPRFIITPTGAASSVALLDQARCLRRAEIRAIEVFTSRGVFSLLAIDGRRLNFPWRWVRLHSRETPDLLSAGREIRDLLGAPATEVRGLRKGREVRTPI